MQTQKIRIKTYISVLVEKKNVQVFYKIFYFLSLPGGRDF